MKTNYIESMVKRGAEMFHKGAKCVPAHDFEVMKEIENNLNVPGATILILDSWLKGWQTEWSKS